MQVIVRDNKSNRPCGALKKKMQREGLFREMKERRAYEKPSERRVRERAQAIARQRKAARKRLQREGLLAPPSGAHPADNLHTTIVAGSPSAAAPSQERSIMEELHSLTVSDERLEDQPT